MFNREEEKEQKKHTSPDGKSLGGRLILLRRPESTRLPSPNSVAATPGISVEHRARRTFPARAGALVPSRRRSRFKVPTHLLRLARGTLHASEGRARHLRETLAVRLSLGGSAFNTSASSVCSTRIAGLRPDERRSQELNDAAGKRGA